MPNYPLTRFHEQASLTDDEAQILRSLGDPEIVYRRNTTIRRDREPVDGLYLLLEGWATSSIRLPAGQRQIVKVHITGDMMGTPSMVLDTAADTLTAVSECRVSKVSLTRLREVLIAYPRLGSLLLMGVQVERLALMDIVAAMGKSSARERMVRLLLDLHDRLSKIDAVEDGRFDMPLTQELLGDALGLTAVHVNRTMRLLEREGLIARHGQRIVLGDIEALRKISPLPPRRIRFDPVWLPGPGEM
ncbi:cAMP-binding domain of CRP or a regulatory subunit of cAMP-dependent protein kinases [Sphingomonas sp. NFR04]|uniref:Crp/Fnr family transcriptional regulator n=1 Tax=Sphingomonas sp. NFR04 TaxID=1566283 RepID=UPI0008F0B954|nr:Crp/Fnr family transcriptional regulator [Sphingomonas sp. NFR04]SFJ86473.1 cAMP-binding domain of CRP or a regulatory subunit of cAMP-dependent protein kinases [Sphingomonas sp. NFR04]